PADVGLGLLGGYKRLLETRRCFATLMLFAAPAGLRRLRFAAGCPARGGGPVSLSGLPISIPFAAPAGPGSAYIPSATSVPAGTTVTISSSSSAPPGAPVLQSTLRHAGSAGATTEVPIVYVTAIFSATNTL
ncbi:MAG: hypothetical protein ABI182_00590, partial [Candidatus Baltobacteraceae bacterium]